MKFTKIQLRGLTDVDLNVVGASPTDPYVLKAADGLGPPEVVVSISNTQNMGGVYQGRRPLSREITLRVGLVPNYALNQTASDLRTTLYGLLTPGLDDKVYVNIIDDNNPQPFRMGTVGWIKRIEVVPFSKDPEVQITIACEKTYFDHADFFVDIPGVGTRNNLVFTNVGSAPSGMVLNVQMLGGIERFELSTPSADVIMSLTRIGNYPNGSVLTIDSRPGNRAVTLVGGGVPDYEADHAWIVDPGSKWPMSYGGLNTIIAKAYTPALGLSTNWSWGNIFYEPKHWGI